MKVPRRVASVVAAAGIASLTCQRIAEARDRRRFPPPGRLVGIGGRRLHLVDAGQGSPAVVIIPALAENVLPWLGLLEGAAIETRVCVYDRAGLGWSDAPPRGRQTPAAMASDLHALLQAAGIPPPYVVAGHSLGGVIGRRFQADYPEAVAGMLLIDSAHEDHARRLGAIDWREGPAGSSRRRPGGS
jgi:pimeloyl-ACP methyl ester carboxylesterase